MNIDYVLYDPTGNMTILVETPVVPASQPAVAAELLAHEPTAEQVGFLSPGDDTCDLALRMAGGEFCGNASISAAAWYCGKTGRTFPTVRLRVSGAADPVTVDMAPLPGGDWLGAVTMPPAKAPVPVTLPLRTGEVTLPMVDMGGILHLVLTEPMAREDAEVCARRWSSYLGAPALGLMQLDLAKGDLTPLVCVPGADTLYWERSCASGTAAVACYLAWKQGGNARYRFAEPGGILEVHADPDGHALLRGCVKLRRRGSLEVSVPAL